jgi:outer membrane lipoprotein-sorting protein
MQPAREFVKRHFLLVILGFIACTGLPAVAGKKSPSPKTANAAPTPADDLKTVLADMNRGAASFKSAQADMEWVQYTRAVDEKDTQVGQIFFRRSGKEMDAAVQFTKPHAKQAVIQGGKIKMRDLQTNQTTVRDISKNRDDMESLMSLGFGARGDDLLKSYDINMTGWEVVDNVKTARLELVGKTDRLKQFFSKAILWIDPVRAIPLQQQRLQSSGDYQLVHYTNIKLNGKVPDDVFHLKGGSE